MVHGTCSSVTIDGVLPSLKHFLVGLFFISNTFLVFDLGKFGGSLVVHLSLEVSADLSVALTHLSEDVSLMGLLVHGHHGGLGHEGLVLAGHFSVDHGLVVSLQPEGLVLVFLLQLDVGFTVLVDILKEVGSSLVLTSPLLLAGVPLLLVLGGNETFDHLLVLRLVALGLLVEFLESHDLLSSGLSLLLFEVLDGFFSLEGGLKHVLIAGFFGMTSGQVQLAFGFVVADEILVALSVESKTLRFHVFLLGSFFGPLVSEHASFFVSQFSFLLTLDLSSVSLPVTDGHSVGYQRFLSSGFLNLTVGLLLGVEFPKLSVDHLFIHLRLELSSLVNELLLTLNGSSVGVEYLIFLAELISSRLESLVHASVDLSLTLVFTLALQVLHTLKHLGTDLFRGFEAVLEFYFILRLFGRQKLGEALLALVEVSSFTSLHVRDSVADHTVLNGLHSFSFPVSLVMQVTVSVDGANHH